MTGTRLLRTTRRRVLRAPAAAVAAGLVAAGCDLSGSSDPGARTTLPTASGTPEPTVAPPADPDEALVARVRTEIAEAAAVVTAAGAGRPSLGRELASLAGLHRRHLRALPGDDPAISPAQVRGGAADARRQVREREGRLQGALADAAVESSSGPLAALLASMSAAVAQRLSLGEAAP